MDQSLTHQVEITVTGQPYVLKVASTSYTHMSCGRGGKVHIVTIVPMPTIGNVNCDSRM